MAVPSDGAAHQHVAERHRNRAQAIEVSVGFSKAAIPASSHQTASPSMTAESALVRLPMPSRSRLRPMRLLPYQNAPVGGFQGGIDLLRGSLIAGHYERAGLYGAFGNVNADVNGLVTNPAATGYILTHTGSLNLEAGSAGGYWTHVGPGGWYLDGVLQGT